ncbi:unnamed protein product [Sphagnum jensenii]
MMSKAGDRQAGGNPVATDRPSRCTTHHTLRWDLGRTKRVNTWKLDDSGDQQQTRKPPPSLSSLFAMFLCCVCDEKRKVTGSRPAAGVCPNCGGGTSQVRVLNMFRFCFIPVCCTTHSRLMCTRCGAQLSR